MKSKVAFNAKDTKIADLSIKVRELEKQVADSSKASGNHKTELDKCHKELERFYLEAIGNANTVKQVNAVLKRYHESSLYIAWASKVVADILMVSHFSVGQSKQKGSQIEQAAATKIKRINRRDAEEVCDLLDTQMDRNCYASSMAAVIEGIADIEVDRTKILDAKDSGLDAWNVLLSMLSAYGVKADSVLEVK